MLKAAAAGLFSIGNAIPGMRSAEALRGFAMLALQESSSMLPVVKPTATDVQSGASSTDVAHTTSQLQTTRQMSYAYARTIKEKPYVYRKHEAEFGFGKLTEYLVKVSDVCDPECVINVFRALA